MTKLILAFHNFANAPKKGTYSCFSIATTVTRTLNNVSSRNKITLYVHCLPRSWLHSQNCEKRLLAFSCQSVRPSVRMERLGSHWTDFHEILYEYFSKKKLWRTLKFHYNRTRITGTLHEDQYNFLIISRSVLLRMRNVSDKVCRGNKNTHFALSNFSFNRAVYETMWKNMVQPDTPQMTIWRMSVAYCITKGTKTHSQYVIITLFHCNNG